MSWMLWGRSLFRLANADILISPAIHIKNRFLTLNRWLIKWFWTICVLLHILKLRKNKMFWLKSVFGLCFFQLNNIYFDILPYIPKILHFYISVESYVSKYFWGALFSCNFVVFLLLLVVVIWKLCSHLKTKN